MSAVDRIEQYVVVRVIAFNAVTVERAVENRSS